MTGAHVGQLTSGTLALYELRGFRGVGNALAVRLRSRRQYIRFRLDLTTWRSPVVPDPDIEFVTGLDALERFRTDAHRWLPVDFYHDRLRGGGRVYLGLWRGQVSHVSWLLLPGDPTRLIDLCLGEAELGFAYTFPWARGRGIQPAAQRRRLSDARRDGATVAYAHVARDNVASQRGTRKAGFRPVELVTLEWILGVPRLSVEPLPPGQRIGATTTSEA